MSDNPYRDVLQRERKRALDLHKEKVQEMYRQYDNIADTFDEEQRLRTPAYERYNRSACERAFYNSLLSYLEDELRPRR